MKILQEITVPQESVNDDTLSVVALLFENHAFVNRGDELIELETSKAVFAIESEFDGYVEYLCKQKDEVRVNSIIIRILESLPKTDTPQVSLDTKISENSNFTTLFSKKAEDYIAKHKIDKTLFPNTDFISYDDVIQLISPGEKTKAVQAIQPEKSNNHVISEVVDSKKVILEELTKNKKREIEYLSAVQREHLNSTVDVIVNTEGVFENINPNLKYFKNSLLPIIIYEVSRLLIKYPEFNAYYTDGNLALYNQINVGFAIDMVQGLKTVKLPETQKLSVSEIEQFIMDLSNKYIDNKLTISDLTDITFTITDLSSEGVNSFIPLINKNNSAILGISANDSVLNRTTLSLTFDHRVTAGKQAAVFLTNLKQRIESFKSNTPKAYKNVICHRCLKTLEDDLNGIGFLRVVTPNGDAYICQTCFSGF